MDQLFLTIANVAIMIVLAFVLFGLHQQTVEIIKGVRSSISTMINYFDRLINSTNKIDDSLQVVQQSIKSTADDITKAIKEIKPEEEPLDIYNVIPHLNRLIKGYHINNISPYVFQDVQIPYSQFIRELSSIKGVHITDVSDYCTYRSEYNCIKTSRVYYEEEGKSPVLGFIGVEYNGDKINTVYIVAGFKSTVHKVISTIVTGEQTSQIIKNEENNYLFKYANNIVEFELDKIQKFIEQNSDIYLRVPIDAPADMVESILTGLQINKIEYDDTHMQVYFSNNEEVKPITLFKQIIVKMDEVIKEDNNVQEQPVTEVVGAVAVKKKKRKKKRAVSLDNRHFKTNKPPKKEFMPRTPVRMGAVKH